ncbi:MAG: biopolymer transporter ExbD [Crocinitomicaceae bacterium]|nr:biopolymer transporter ExbD [Crocinitomicaceae bacterium]MDG1657069.1 biopolymer transporter ExbD [Crocinitomicaceae bacterium]|tara:strand:- start:843 stop:1253 length:411 start_codon:yes stop_codon:yes gene_type:complete
MGMSSKNKIKVEGGMSSMTDLVFLLLIFFIIISIMSNDTTPLDLPNPSETLDPVKKKVNPTVVVTEDNLYYVMPGGDASNPMPFEDIKTPALGVVEESGKLQLKIAGHKLADYEAVFQVLALCQANGWDPVLAYDK